MKMANKRLQDLLVDYVIVGLWKDRELQFHSSRNLNKHVYIIIVWFFYSVKLRD